MTEKTPLTEAAHAVLEARNAVEQVAARIADLTERKARELDPLKAAHAEARERRAQQLENDLIAGRKSNTDEADKAVDKALRALQRREDEFTATERALGTLGSQLEEARAALADREEEYSRAIAGHAMTNVQRAMTAGSALARQAHAAFADARACLTSLPPQYLRERASLDAAIDVAEREQRHMEGRIGSGPFSTRLEADLAEAHKLTGAEPAREAEFIGYAASDGTVTQQPPAPVNEAERTRRLELHDRDAAGLRGAA